MLSRQVTKERQPRSKNGQPAQRTTGVASTASTYCVQVTDIRCGSPDRTASCSIAPARSNPGMPSPIASSSNGSERTSATQKRRVMSRSSGLSPSAAVGVTGSSAIPQMGQLPGALCRTCGCIGQV